MKTELLNNVTAELGADVEFCVDGVAVGATLADLIEAVIAAVESGEGFEALTARAKGADVDVEGEYWLDDGESSELWAALGLEAAFEGWAEGCVDDADVIAALKAA